MSSPSTWIVINGKLGQINDPGFFSQNRAFRLGDGFFETVRITSGEPHLWESHFARIARCCEELQLILPNHFTSDFFLESLRSQIDMAGIRESGKLRLTFYREGDGAYRPETNKVGFLCEVWSLNHSRFHVRDEGVQLGIYLGLKKQVDRLARFKLLGNHIYMQAAIWAEQNNMDDALILNSSGRLIEATASNLFIVRGGEIHTPPVSDGCVGGVMRMAVLNLALQNSIACYESQLDAEDLLAADEVFLTNAIQGVIWVRSFREKRYYHKLSDRLIQKLNEVTVEAGEVEKPQLSVGSDGK